MKNLILALLLLVSSVALAQPATTSGSGAPDGTCVDYTSCAPSDYSPEWNISSGTSHTYTINSGTKTVTVSTPATNCTNAGVASFKVLVTKISANTPYHTIKVNGTSMSDGQSKFIKVANNGANSYNFTIEGTGQSSAVITYKFTIHTMKSRCAGTVVHEIGSTDDVTVTWN